MVLDFYSRPPRTEKIPVVADAASNGLGSGEVSVPQVREAIFTVQVLRGFGCASFSEASQGF